MTVSDFAIDGSTAIITGSSSGIGQWIAERFAAQGVDVVVCSREQANVDPVADGINASDRDGRAVAVECDVTDWEAVEALRAVTLEEFGSIDILVNNAGAGFPCPFEDLSLNGWRTIIDINLTGVFVTTRLIGEEMRESADGGTIVNISSIVARDGSPMMSHYGAAKAGLENLTRTLGVEWAPDDVRVNCVSPGLIATAAMEELTGGVDPADIDRDEVDRRIGHPDEVATAVQYLCSPAASYVQGETLVVEGVPRAQTLQHD